MTNPRLLMLGALVSQQHSPFEVVDNEWPTIVKLALQHGLGPMLFHALRQCQYDVSANPCLLPLIQVTHQTAMGYALLEKTEHEVNAALSDANIPALWLKGAALAQTVYPEPTLRPMGDLDVLVPFEQRERALKVVQSLGYDFYISNNVTSRSSGDEMTVKLSHHYHLRGGIAKKIVLELHFKLLTHNSELLLLDDLRWFWDQQRTLFTDDSTALSILTPEAHLLYLCAHAMLQHGEASFYLLRFFDLHQIVTQTALHWDVIVDQAVALGWTYAVERALTHSIECFGTPVPETVLGALVSRRPQHEDATRVKQLAGAGSRWASTSRKMTGMSLREKLAFARPRAIPARSYMRHRYHIKPGWPTWPYYFYRWFDQGRDVMRFTWKSLTRQYK